MDLLALAAVVRELAARLGGAVLSRAVQTAPEALVLEWWAGRRGELRLLVSVDPEAPRIHLTSQTASALREAPSDDRPAGRPRRGRAAGRGAPEPGRAAGPPRFAAWLRAHARDARLLEIVQPPGDRVAVLRLGRGEDRLDLVVELFGAQAEVVAVGGDGRVGEALRRVTAAGGRRLAPGDPYTPPPRSGRPPFAALPEAVRELAAAGMPDVQALARCAAGMTGPLAAHLLAAAGGPQPDRSRLLEAAADLVARVKAGRFEPRLYRRADEPPLLAMLPLAHLEADAAGPAAGVEVETFVDASAAVEARYASPADRLARRAAPLRARLVRARDRLVRRQAALAGDRADLERAGDAGRLGDLLAAQRHLLARGQREVRVTDLFDPDGRTLAVKLDPALDPQGNIEAYYARARKSRRGLETVAAREAETRAELEYLDQALYAVDAAEGPEELTAVEEELATQGLVQGAGRPASGGRGPGRTRLDGAPAERKAPRGVRGPPRLARGGAQAGRRGRRSAPPDVRRFRSSDGIEIVAGKTNLSNDYVSTRLARAEDLWLHAEGYPGAHVLVRRAGRAEIPERTVLEAAAVAALHSKARGEARVPVHVARAAAVKKPRGARPGLVTLAGGHRTVVVVPDAALVARLAAAAAGEPAGGGDA